MARTTFSVRLLGADEVKNMLKDFAPNEARNIMRGTVQKVAVQARDLMKIKVKKRTEKLAHTIRALRRRGEKDVFVSHVRLGREAPYGIMLEFGTRHTRAQPFIVPTVEELTPKLSEIYREEFGKQLERALARRANKVRT